MKIFIDALDKLETVFTVYDENYQILFANQAAKKARPMFFKAIDGGKSIWDATYDCFKNDYPYRSEEKLKLDTDRILRLQRSGEQYEVKGVNGMVYAMTHEKIDENRILGLGIDVSDIKNHQAELEKLASQNFILANTDQLTKLANRRHFTNVLEQGIAFAQDLYPEFHIGLIDLNGFKRINDTYGHAIGDLLLQEVASRFKSTISEGDFLARLGGDEFAVICRGNNRPDQLFNIGNDLCDVMRPHCWLDGNSIQLSASIGWSSFPKNGETVSDLLRKSDYALYQAKARRGGCSVVFTDEHEDSIRRQSTMNALLDNAPLEDELYIEFQPIHDTSNGSIMAFEALARWQSPVLGRLTPDEFIPAAENIGRINTVSQILLAKALELAKGWPPDIHLHFNLSAIDLSRVAFVSALVDIVEMSDFPGSNLIFELTETAILQNLNDLDDVFEILNRAGIRLSLDDFGKGYSSLSYLTQIPISILKIDKSFTERLRFDTDEEIVLETINYMCAKLGIDCIVEGVEDGLQVAQLKSIGLLNMQGYYFSKSLPVENVAAYILKQSHGEFSDDRKLRIQETSIAV